MSSISDYPDILTIGSGFFIRLDGTSTTLAQIPFAQGVSVSDGLVGTPSIAFTSDTNTGLYRIGADNFGFTAGGALMAEIKNGSGFDGLGIPLNNYLWWGTDGGISVSTSLIYSFDDDAYFWGFSSSSRPSGQGINLSFTSGTSASGSGGALSFIGGDGSGANAGGVISFTGGNSSTGNYGYSRFGSGTPNRFTLTSSTTKGSVFIGNNLEVDGVAYFDAGLVVPDNIEIQIGGAGPGTLSGYYGAGVLKLLDSGPFSKVRAITLGTVTSNTIGPGLDFIFTAGSTSASGEAGGDINFTSGASTTAGSGGGMNFSAGLAVGAAQTGGNISFTPGAGSGGATAGVIRAYDYSTPGPLTLFDSNTGISYAKTLNITADSNQIVLDSDGTTTTLTDSATSNRAITFPDGDTTLAGLALNNTWTGTNYFENASSTAFYLNDAATGGLGTVALASGGTGYAVGDVVGIDSGTNGQIQVVSLSGSAISTFTIYRAGSGYTVANGYTSTAVTGAGSGATFNVTAIARTMEVSGTNKSIGLGVPPASDAYLKIFDNNRVFGIQSQRTFTASTNRPRFISAVETYGPTFNVGFASPGAIALYFDLQDNRQQSGVGGGDLINWVYLTANKLNTSTSNRSSPSLQTLITNINDATTYTPAVNATYTTTHVASALTQGASVFNYAVTGTSNWTHRHKWAHANINFSGISSTTSGTHNLDYAAFVSQGTASTVGTTYYVGFHNLLTGFDTNWSYVNETNANNYMGQDNARTYFGTGSGTVAARSLASDASIYYDGTNFIINPKEIGTGYLSVLGNQLITGTGAAVYPYNLNVYSNTADSYLGIFNDGSTAAGAFFGMSNRGGGAGAGDAFEIWNFQAGGILFLSNNGVHTALLNTDGSWYVGHNPDTVYGGSLSLVLPGTWNNTDGSKFVHVKADAANEDAGVFIRGQNAGTLRGIDLWYDASTQTAYLDSKYDAIAGILVGRVRTNNATPVESFRMVDTEFVINAGSIDYNFRVESNGDANNIFSDGGTDRVGIGNNAPGYKLDVTGDANVSGVYRVGGTAGLSATYTFGGGSSGDIATMTFTGGILTGVTVVP